MNWPPIRPSSPTERSPRTNWPPWTRWPPAGLPEIPRLRRSLLLIAGAIGSVSALAKGLGDVRNAVELFGGPPLH